MLTRLIYPLSLRQKISWRLRRYVSPRQASNIGLYFNPRIRLDLAWADVGHQSIILNGFYELKLSRSILALAETGGLLIDVGANYGYFTGLWAGQKPENRVIAFEASPFNVAPLQHNMAKNGFTERVRVEPLAVGKSTGRFKFDVAAVQGQTGWGRLTLENHDSLTEVGVITLDEYAQQHNISQIDVLKIDVEGADTWVLQGSVNLLKEQRIKHIFYESNPNRMEVMAIDPAEAQNFLMECGYKVERFSREEYHAYLHG